MVHNMGVSKMKTDKVLKIIAMVLLTLLAFKMFFSQKVIYAIVMWVCVAIGLFTDIYPRFKNKGE